MKQPKKLQKSILLSKALMYSILHYITKTRTSILYQKQKQNQREECRVQSQCLHTCYIFAGSHFSVYSECVSLETRWIHTRLSERVHFNVNHPLLDIRRPRQSMPTWLCGEIWKLQMTRNVLRLKKPSIAVDKNICLQKSHQFQKENPF